MTLLHAAVTAAAAVPAPDLPARPETYQPGWPTITLLVVGAIAVVLFVASVLTAGRRASDPRAVLAPVLVTVAVALVGVLGGALLYRHGEQAHQDEYRAWVLAVDAERPVLRDSLESAYGIQIDEWEHIPVEPGAFDQLSVTLADGTPAECWFTLEDAYDVRCGDTRSDSTPLRPASDGA